MAKYGALWGVADGQQEAMKLLQQLCSRSDCMDIKSTGVVTKCSWKH